VAATYRGAPPAHPVLVALADVLERDSGRPAVSLRQYHFRRLLDTREADALDGQPPLDLAGLEAYAEGTASQVATTSHRLSLRPSPPIHPFFIRVSWREGLKGRCGHTEAMVWIDRLGGNGGDVRARGAGEGMRRMSVQRTPCETANTRASAPQRA
jgi:hypothetical protein